MKITIQEVLALRDIFILADRSMVRDLLIERAALKKQIADLLAGDAGLQAKALELFTKSEAAEAKLRGGLAAAEKPSTDSPAAS